MAEREEELKSLPMRVKEESEKAGLKLNIQFFIPPSDAYVRSFLYLLYTLVKLYYTKALSDQASSLAPD